MNEITRKDLSYYVKSWLSYGYGLKVGYCCYQDDNNCKYNLTEVGYNRGVYGWNFTLYVDHLREMLYISCYRNVPDYIYKMQCDSEKNIEYKNCLQSGIIRG